MIYSYGYENNIEEHTEWIYCPTCGNKTRLQIREDTELKIFLSTVQNVKGKH